VNATTAQLAQAIASAPAFAIIALTMPDEQMRERGAEELARWIERSQVDQPDARQIALPL
jgi:hypothetical protein